ncbi:hypothetical protein JTB14_037513 [Gonioctena quinquepunctata]|nr:hypothetical protein JTB14_037513 [Gonioctena quinquepunctata]
MSSRRNFRRPLTDEELLESLENDDSDDLVPPLDNSTETDIEQSDEEDFQPLRDSLQEIEQSAQENEEPEQENIEAEQEEEPENEEERVQESERKWKKKYEGSRSYA